MTRPKSAATATGYRGKLYQETNARFEKRNPQETPPREIEVQALKTPRFVDVARNVSNTFEMVGDAWLLVTATRPRVI